MSTSGEEFELLAATLWQSEPRLGFLVEMYVASSVLAGAVFVDVKVKPSDATVVPTVKNPDVGALTAGQRVLVVMANNRAYTLMKIP